MENNIIKTKQVRPISTDPLDNLIFIRVKALATCLSVTKNTIWVMCREGRFPAPIRLSPKVTVWKVADIREWIAKMEVANAKK
jgi:predicted DNA-binding transcriptional regulator AlpA